MANHPSRGVNPEMASEVEGVKVVLVVKNSPANVGDIRDAGSVPGWEGPLEEGMAAHSSVLAGRIPRTEEPGGLRAIAWQSWTRLN